MRLVILSTANPQKWLLLAIGLPMILDFDATILDYQISIVNLGESVRILSSK